MGALLLIALLAPAQSFTVPCGSYGAALQACLSCSGDDIAATDDVLIGDGNALCFDAAKNYCLWFNGSYIYTDAGIYAYSSVRSTLLLASYADTSFGDNVAADTCQDSCTHNHYGPLRMFGMIRLARYQTDPCNGTDPGESDGWIWFNDVSDIPCYCDGAVDKKVSDDSACF